MTDSGLLDTHAQQSFAGYFLYPLTPIKAFDRCVEDVNRLIPLDAKLAKAIELLNYRLEQLGSDQEREILGALLWLRLRPLLKHRANLAALRRAFGDGDAVLRYVERSLATTFDVSVLQAVLKEVEAGRAPGTGQGTDAGSGSDAGRVPAASASGAGAGSGYPELDAALAEIRTSAVATAVPSVEFAGPVLLFGITLGVAAVVTVAGVVIAYGAGALLGSGNAGAGDTGPVDGGISDGGVG